MSIQLQYIQKPLNIVFPKGIWYKICQDQKFPPHQLAKSLFEFSAGFFENLLFVASIKYINGYNMSFYQKNEFGVLDQLILTNSN